MNAVDILKQARIQLTPRTQWVKNEWLDEKKDGTPDWQACSMGAMLLAEFQAKQQDPNDNLDFEDRANQFIEYDPEFKRATTALAEAILKNHPKRMGDAEGFDLTDNEEILSIVVTFNDADKTTHKNVLKAFDTAITELEK
jgi:hypothetical protein